MLANDATYKYIENLSNSGKWALETEDLEELGSVYERELTNLASDRIPFVQEELICFGKKLIRKYNVNQIRGILPFEKDLAQKINNHFIKQEILLGPYAEGTKILSRDDNSDEKQSIDGKIQSFIETHRDFENRLDQALKGMLYERTRYEAEREIKFLLTNGVDATKFLAFAKTTFEEAHTMNDPLNRSLTRLLHALWI